MNPSKNPDLKDVLNALERSEGIFKGKGSASFMEYQSFLRHICNTARVVASGAKYTETKMSGDYAGISLGINNELYAIRNRVQKREEMLEAMHDFISVAERREQVLKAWYELENEHKLNTA
jgi:hypothetical protein